MSWSISTEVKRESPDIAQKFLDTFNTVDRSHIGNEHCKEERDEQIHSAVKAVIQLLVEAGFDNADVISVSMSGHANKDHKKDSSWSNEFINLNVAIKSYKEML